jgi:hypothetical protein
MYCPKLYIRNKFLYLKHVVSENVVQCVDIAGKVTLIICMKFSEASAVDIEPKPSCVSRYKWYSCSFPTRRVLKVQTATHNGLTQ